jgi:hypothetical protein
MRTDRARLDTATYAADANSAFVRSQLTAVPCWFIAGECCGRFPHALRMPRDLPAPARAAWLADVVADLKGIKYAGESK